MWLRYFTHPQPRVIYLDYTLGFNSEPCTAGGSNDRLHMLSRVFSTRDIRPYDIAHKASMAFREIIHANRLHAALVVAAAGTIAKLVFVEVIHGVTIIR